jgi:hypothetical protein
MTQKETPRKRGEEIVAALVSGLSQRKTSIELDAHGR